MRPHSWSMEYKHAATTKRQSRLFDSGNAQKVTLTSHVLLF